MDDEILRLLNDRRVKLKSRSELFDTLPIGFCITDYETDTFVNVNEQFAQWCDYDSPEDMVGVCYYDLMLPEDLERIREVVEHNRQTETQQEVYQEIYNTYLTPKNNIVLFKWYVYVDSSQRAACACFMISKYPAK